MHGRLAWCARYNRVADNVWCPIPGQNMSFMGNWSQPGAGFYDDTNTLTNNTKCGSALEAVLYGAVLETVGPW